jgi:hypothetical protein
MKQFLLCALLAAGTMQMVSAQDLKKVQTAVLLKQWENAKVEVDKAMADPKQNTKPEAIYWKARVYSAIAADAQLRTKYPSSLKDADEALQKYIAVDPAFAQVKDKGADPFFDVYSTSYSTGVKLFNDKKWDEAATSFTNAVKYSDLIFQNKWANSGIPFDTTSILYLAYSYQNGQKPDEAAKTYGRLADAKVAGESYIDLYKFLAAHYTATKNEALFQKYVGIGKELYPKYAWDEFEIDYMDQNLTLAQKTALYDKESAAGTLSELKLLQFGDIFVSLKNKEKGLDSAQLLMYSLKAADAYKKAFAKNPQNAIAAYNTGIIYYNIYGEYDDVYASNIRAMQGLNADRPVEKDPKKKAAADAALKAKVDPIKAANAAIEKPLMDNLDLSIEWLEKSYLSLKESREKSLNDKTEKTKEEQDKLKEKERTEKSILNKSVDFLANLYAYKRDRVRGKDLKAMDAYEAKYKEYDALHGKF